MPVRVIFQLSTLYDIFFVMKFMSDKILVFYRGHFFGQRKIPFVQSRCYCLPLMMPKCHSGTYL